MATGMMRWLGVTALGIAAVAALMLPPRDVNQLVERLGGPMSRPLAPASERYRELHTEVGRVHTLLQRVRTQDALEPRLEALAGGDAGYAFEDRVGIGDEALDGFRGRLAGQLASLPADRRTVLGVFLIPSSHGSSPGAERYPRPGKEIYAGTLGDGSPYCMKVYRLSGPTARNLRYQLDSDPLGLCRYFARYGPPGPDIRRWLEATAWAFATGGPTGDLAGDPRRFDIEPRRGPFGQRATQGAWRAGHLTESCISQDPAACAELLRDPGRWERSGMMFFGDTRWAHSARIRTGSQEVTSFVTDEWGTSEGPFSYLSGLLLEDLEREEGPDAFGRFWTAGGSMETAFAEAFGEDPGVWVQGWIRSYVPPVRAGPTLPPVTAGLTLLTVLLVGGSGLLVHHRRGTAG